MSRALILVCALVGCRFGFDDVSASVSDATDASVDGAPDVGNDTSIQGITTVRFGERAGADVTGVTTDVALLQDEPNVAYGTADRLALSGAVNYINRSLIRFDISSLAPGTQIVAARLHVETVDTGDENPGMLSLTVPTEAWVEATANWVQRDTGQAWLTAGGTPAAQLIPAFMPTSTALEIEVPATLVQGWVDAPASNLGLMVVVADESINTHYHAHSSESSTAAARPMLVVEYASSL